MKPVDRLAHVRGEIRLLLIREAAMVRPPALNGRTIVEALRLLLPEVLDATQERRHALATKTAGLLLPGALWLADVVEATWRLWESPSCSIEDRSRLALPVRYTSVTASVIYHPSDLEELEEYLDEEEALAFATPKKQHGEDQVPIVVDPSRRSRGPKMPKNWQAALVAGYQWGLKSRSRLVKEYGIEEKQVTRILHRWSTLLPLELRDPLPAGRPKRA